MLIYHCFANKVLTKIGHIHSLIQNFLFCLFIYGSLGIIIIDGSLNTKIVEDRTMLKVGFVGWRGMVGSVLMDRMLDEKDFKGYEPVFATTSQVGQKGPDIGISTPPLFDAFDINKLMAKIGEAKQKKVLLIEKKAEEKVRDLLRSKGW